jgi:hypothetical protein
LFLETKNHSLLMVNNNKELTNWTYSLHTVVQIVDPKDSTRMISVDARTGRFIGESGKEPAAAARDAKTAIGKNELASELDNIRIAYDNLNQMRAIPSTGRNVLSNIAAGTAASGVGQAVGRLAGTPEQTERDVIKSGRLRLVNAIKNATGMSAQQLNSNVELKNMLDSVTDPSQSIETVNRILDQIQETYLTGAAPSMGRPGAAKPAARPAAAPAAGKARPSVDARRIQPCEITISFCASNSFANAVRS